MSDRPPLEADLVRRLVADQFPQWADLTIRPVEPGGWDNRTFHLGEAMLARLPSARRYAEQAEKERAWLPRLAPRLPVAIPEPLALGRPGHGYPFAWSVYRWIPGETAKATRFDEGRLARDLADFLTALQAIDAAEGPPPGPHNFLRGASPAVYDAQTREALTKLEGRIDTLAAAAIWDAALVSKWSRPPVWLHGDVAPGNLILRDGRLAAVIDWGICGVGDPACDLAMAWTVFDGEARAAFRDGLDLDADTWTRARGWALWKALIVLARGPGHHDYAAQERAIGELFGA